MRSEYYKTAIKSLPVNSRPTIHRKTKCKDKIMLINRLGLFKNNYETSINV